MFAIIYLGVGLAAGGFLGWLFTRGSEKGLAGVVEDYRCRYEEAEENNRRLREGSTALDRECAELRAACGHYREQVEQIGMERSTAQEQVLELTRRCAALKSSVQALEEKLDGQKEEVVRVQKEFRAEFENMANKILEEKSRRFTEINRENIGNILKPLGENIESFRKKVEETYDREAKERFSLGKEVEKLVQMNLRISEEASNLTNALKGNSKIQGNWGEMILENILERSGLTRNREYFLQESIKDAYNNSVINQEGRRMIPDAVVVYPDDRKVVIDSKVSLTAYVEYCEADDPDDCRKLASRHVVSVRKHIDELKEKNYQAHVEALDFVMMFMPNEPAYMLALRTDPQLWHYAYGKGVLLISPTNLITSLRLIADLWSREYQNRNAIKIAERGAFLYDKFAGFVKSMNRIGENIRRTTESYDSAMLQLSEGRGNLIGQVEKLRDLGVKGKKQLVVSDTHENGNENETPEEKTENGSGGEVPKVLTVE